MKLDPVVWRSPTIESKFSKFLQRGTVYEYVIVPDSEFCKTVNTKGWKWVCTTAVAGRPAFVTVDSQGLIRNKPSRNLQVCR